MLANPGWADTAVAGFDGESAIAPSRLDERDTTPNLKQLGTDSAVYTEAISASDFTLTSHATLFTD